MLNVFHKIIYSFKKPKIILVAGKNKTFASEVIFQILSQYFKVRKIKNKIRISDLLLDGILILELGIKNFSNIEDLIIKSQLLILVVTDSEDSFFETEKLIQKIPYFGCLVLNFDDEKIRNLKAKIQVKNFSFGFEEGVDFRATDVKFNGGTNFKINHKGNMIPIWLEKISDKEKIYSVLAAAGAGEVLGLNLIKISEALKRSF